VAVNLYDPDLLQKLVAVEGPHHHSRIEKILDVARDRVSQYMADAPVKPDDNTDLLHLSITRELSRKYLVKATGEVILDPRGAHVDQVWLALSLGFKIM
jgi:hypothetical protein